MSPTCDGSLLDQRSTLNAKGKEVVVIGTSMGGGGIIITLNAKGQELVKIGSRRDGPGAIRAYDPRSIEARGVLTTRP